MKEELQEQTKYSQVRYSRYLPRTMRPLLPCVEPIDSEKQTGYAMDNFDLGKCKTSSLMSCFCLNRLLARARADMPTRLLSQILSPDSPIHLAQWLAEDEQLYRKSHLAPKWKGKIGILCSKLSLHLIYCTHPSIWGEVR